MSVLENVKTESEKTYEEKVYLGAKANFPINVEREFRIIKGNPSRQLFLTKTTGCRSFDGVVGKIIESGYKEERECATCNYKFGFTNDAGEKIQCKSRYTLTLEHEDPNKQYILNIAYGAQINLDTYANKLAAEGLDVDQVITGIKRIENIATAGTTYVFRKVREIGLDVTTAEAAALGQMKAKAMTGSPIPVIAASTILQSLASLAGISEERATRLAESIAVDGMITGESN